MILSKVYIRFPKTGLGNMLLVWARGVVFARLNNITYTTSAWWGLRWGALIRGEKKKRIYMGYFIESPWWRRWALNVYCKLVDTIKEPAINTVPGLNDHNKKIYLFNKVITDNDLFGSVRDHRNLVSEELDKVLTPKMKKKLSGYEAPVIGVHIRRGDFKLGNQTTAVGYFVKAINVIRTTLGESIPVTIFTDADEPELAELLLLPGITIAEDKPDILDILLLSKSKIMILSKSSTFGYWAAFLSNAIIIRPVDDWQQLIRQNDTTGIYTEVKWRYDDAFSTQELAAKIATVQL